MEDLLAIKSLNSLHLTIGIIGAVLVILIVIFACCKKLANEKFWIAIIALVAFTTYCIIDYDFGTAKFKHNPPNVPCYYYPQDQIPPSQGKPKKDYP